MSTASQNYIPRPDDRFDAWLGNYAAASVPWWSTHGGDGELDTLNDLRAVWLAAYEQHVAAQAAARAASQTKDEARAACEVEIRRLTRIVQAASDTTNAQRAAIGITVREGTPGAPSPMPSSAPLVQVQQSQRLTHRLRLVDDSTPTRRARPRGVLGAEVWVKLVGANGQMAGANSQTPNGQMAKSEEGDARDGVTASGLGNPATFSFLTVTTRSTFRAEFPATDGGKTALYLTRWVNTRGEKGPWSEVAQATVAA